jgi:hypothetical protein
MRRRRYHGEGVGGTVPHLQIAGVRREGGGLGGQADGGDQLAGSQYSVTLRRIARQAVQSLQRHLAMPLRALDLDDRAEGRERNAEI